MMASVGDCGYLDMWLTRFGQENATLDSMEMGFPQFIN